MSSTPNDSKWIAVTAGWRPQNFEEAANRVKRDLVGLFPFQKILSFTVRDLNHCAPTVFEKYKSYLNEGTPGFGYYCWKSEIVNRTLNGEFGECDGVVWIDGGCEVFQSPWTRKRFKSQLLEAERLGYSVYQLETPEFQYTKRDVFSALGYPNPSDHTGQIQANYFFLYGDLGRRISNDWVEATLKSIQLLDNSVSGGGESKDFIAHKADQSIFSLVVKSVDATERMRVPPAGNRGMISQLKALTAPIWVARNRKGKTIKCLPVRLIEVFVKWSSNRRLNLIQQENFDK